MKLFQNQKVFHLGIKEIPTVNSYNLFLIKLSADTISDSSFHLDSVKSQDISAVDSFLFLKRLWNVRLLTDVTLLCSPACKKPIQLFSIQLFPFYSIKISAFDKSKLCNCYMAIYVDQF